MHAHVPMLVHSGVLMQGTGLQQALGKCLLNE